jgi:FecR protein
MGLGLLLPLEGWEALLPQVALAQDQGADATLETRHPDVQWSPAGAPGWQSISDRQSVRGGDRVRTGAGASARLVYFEGSVVDVRGETGLIVQRLERSPEGSLLTRLFVTIGGIVSHVVPMGDSPGQFEIETPASTSVARGTQPRVEVTAGGVTVISNLPDNTGGLVDVQGKDPAQTQVTVAPGLQTQVKPGEAPLEPYPIQPGTQVRYCQGTYVCLR